MGIKKLVTITVEAEIEIELTEDLANPTEKDIEDINCCGFSVENSDDIYQAAARLILLGFDDCNNDVFGVFHQSWMKRTIENPEIKSFFNLRDLSVQDCEVKEIKESK